LQSGKLERFDLFRVFGVNLSFEIGSIKRRLKEYVVEKPWSGFLENLEKEIRDRAHEWMTSLGIGLHSRQVPPREDADLQQLGAAVQRTRRVRNLGIEKRLYPQPSLNSKTSFSLLI
jgi:hypothetical protein